MYQFNLFDDGLGAFERAVLDKISCLRGSDPKATTILEKLDTLRDERSRVIAEIHRADKAGEQTVCLAGIRLLDELACQKEGVLDEAKATYLVVKKIPSQTRSEDLQGMASRLGIKLTNEEA